MKIITAIGAAIAALFAFVPTATADIGLPATTYIYWTGAPCITILTAYIAAPQYAGPSTACGGHWSFSEGNIWPGDAFGADPIMGDADYIECAVFRGGIRVWYDSAVRGDGTDVNCLRRAM